MPLQNTDLFIVERNGVHHHWTADQLNAFINAGQDLTALSYADLLTETFIGGRAASVGDKVFINNADGDPTVDAGFAIYRISGLSPLAFDKIQEGESLDLIVNATDLNYVASAAGGDVTNTNGNGFSIPLATTTLAGLQSPADKAKVHDAATVQAATPLTISGQSIGFNIAQLPALP